MERVAGGRDTRDKLGASWIQWVLCVALGAALGGCLTVGDDEPAILAIDLYWDEEVGTTDFIAGTCHSAGVERMDWSLRDEDGREVAGREESCADTIDIIDAVPGEYELKIQGYDENGDEYWKVTCTGLLVLRFNMIYACNIAAD